MKKILKKFTQFIFNKKLKEIHKLKDLENIINKENIIKK